MRVLVLHQYFLEENDPGGSRWNEITKTWSDKGHEIVVIGGMMHANGSEKLPQYKKKYFVKNKQGKIDVLRCHVSESYNSGFAGRLWGYFSFMFSSLWGGVYKTEGKFDVIIVTSPPLFIGITGYLLSKIKRVPMVFEVRDLWPESAIDTGVLTNKFIIKLAFGIEAFLYKKSKLINVLTPAFQKTLLNQKNVSSDKLILIPNAADFTLSEDIMQTFDRDRFRKENDLDNYFVITYVGAHGVANHLEQLLYAGKKLEDTNVLFLLIGQGMEKKRLMELSIEISNSNIRFLDSVPKKDVFKYIIASDMGASVLKNVETFKTVYSNKTFDYFSCKKPILMAIDGVSKELVEEANAGVFVEPENSEDFSNKIRKYLNNPELVLEQGENGYNFAKNNFDRAFLAEKYIKHIEGLIYEKN